MTERVAISVIISTRNRARYLPGCLDALARQRTAASFEVVVIDNGSTDETPELLTQRCASDPRFRWAREPRLGLSQGKNAGIRIARGSLLMFTDDDTIPVDGWIEAYRAFFAHSSDHIALAGGPVVPVPEDLGEWPPWFSPGAEPDLALLRHEGERPLRRGEYVWGGNMAVPAEVFGNLGLFDVSVGRRGEDRGTFEDAELQDRLRDSGGVVSFCPSAEVKHRIPLDAITPRRVVATAFDRGRNEFWMENIGRWGAEEAVPERPLIGSLALLTVALWRWLLWTIAFRIWPRRGFFERARRAGWSSGRALDGLRAGRGMARVYRRAGRVVFGVRGLVLRLAPDDSR
jgi:glycosyltransferase involved in cell wall biosynthesis